MKQYLIDTFKYNDYANKRMIEKIGELPDKTECIKFISHLINSQNKWMARVTNQPNSQHMSWWDPVYSFEDLSMAWNHSLQTWIDFLEGKKEEDLFEEARFIGFDGGEWAAKIKDIALQLNYHSIHHRAQMQTIIRKQGLEPEFVDYIGTVYKKLS